MGEIGRKKENEKPDSGRATETEREKEREGVDSETDRQTDRERRPDS